MTTRRKQVRRARHGETHASRGSAEFRIWSQMIGRCTNTSHPRYADYGGRGITVCDRWVESVTNFIADMGRRPTDDHTLERVDNDRGYEPGNCRWIPRAEQAQNRRSSIRLEHNGRSMVLASWARALDLPYGTLLKRYRLGWDAQKILCTPVEKHERRDFLSKGQARVLELLGATPGGLTWGRLRDECNASALLARGFIEKAPPGGHFAPYILSEAGRARLTKSRKRIVRAHAEAP